jgi:hypothetical protein
VQPVLNSLTQFIIQTNKRIGIDLPEKWQKLSEIEIAKRFLSSANEFFFQAHAGLGVTQFRGEELDYFSEFHKFWEAHHAEVLNARIDSGKTAVAARLLSKAVAKYGSKIFSVTLDTHGLQPAAIAQVRFLTANQDFREPPSNQFEKYNEDPTQFEASIVVGDPADFLRFMGTTRLSQTDKRLDFATNAGHFLMDKKINAYEIASFFHNNAAEIRDALVESPNMGYGAKKANMFIRDMVELGVWPGLSHYDEIDVASDINTMKVALRTGILVTDIPLVSSFLDMFCWQYAYIDEMSAQAWRHVWEDWTKIDSKTAPRSPCLMDFLLYRIGREYCDDGVVQYSCNDGHTFYHFGARIRFCRKCLEKGLRTPIKVVRRLLPCQVDSNDLPRENGVLMLDEGKLLRVFNGACIFEAACDPKAPGFRPFDPPKSISVKGQTSWTSSYADRDRGGGGMMG